MKTAHIYWYIAVKRIPPIPEDLKEKLISMGVEVLEGKVYIHAHIFIPEPVYVKVEDFFKKSGFEITLDHPAVCSIGKKTDYEIYEKRVPIIEAQESKFLAEMAEYGVLMSGGAGKPHVHLSIPQEKRKEVLSVLDENHYFLKEFSC